MAPGFLQLAGHPVRWALLSALARSDLRVHELTGALQRPQNLVSYHLRRLRAGGLVSARRSAADARDTYYSLDLQRCGELLAAAGAALHPALTVTPPALPTPRRRAGARVLFACTGNSARSRMAEAFLRERSGGAIAAASAGSHPKPLHPLAVTAMAEYGIALPDRPSRHLDAYAGRRFSHVVTLCDRVREVCPEPPGERIHWSIPDPAREPDGLAAFQRCAADLSARVDFLIHRIANHHTAEETP